MRRGRKEKLNYEQIEEQIYQMGMIQLDLTDIATIFNISPATLSRYQKRHPILRQAYQRGKAKAPNDLKQRAMQEAMKGNIPMIKYCLRNLSKWSDDAIIDQSTHKHVTIVTQLHQIASNNGHKDNGKKVNDGIIVREDNTRAGLEFIK